MKLHGLTPVVSSSYSASEIRRSITPLLRQLTDSRGIRNITFIRGLTCPPVAALKALAGGRPWYSARRINLNRDNRAVESSVVKNGILLVAKIAKALGVAMKDLVK